MTASIAVYDEFAADLPAVRAAVIGGPVVDLTGPDGARYTNISRLQVPQWIERLERVMGFPIDVAMAGFRFDLAGELPHNHVHADTICAEYAALVYLNPPEQTCGGTAFWEHVRTGRERMPTEQELPADQRAAIEQDWVVRDAWRLGGFVGMRCNRLLVYPTAMFHSRYPHEGFGTTLADGRLVWVCFFSRKAAAPKPAAAEADCGVGVIALPAERLEELSALGAGFYREGQLPGRFEPAVFATTWRELLKSGLGAIFALEQDGHLRGAIGAVRHNDPNDAATVVSEMFWYVCPEARGSGLRLLRQFEQWGKEQAACRLVMVHLEGLHPRELGHLYERRGYKRTETYYIKEI